MNTATENQDSCEGTGSQTVANTQVKAPAVETVPKYKLVDACANFMLDSECGGGEGVDFVPDEWEGEGVSTFKEPDWGPTYINRPSVMYGDVWTQVAQEYVHHKPRRVIATLNRDTGVPSVGPVDEPSLAHPAVWAYDASNEVRRVRVATSVASEVLNATLTVEGWYMVICLATTPDPDPCQWCSDRYVLLTNGIAPEMTEEWEDAQVSSAVPLPSEVPPPIGLTREQEWDGWFTVNAKGKALKHVPTFVGTVRDKVAMELYDRMRVIHVEPDMDGSTYLREVLPQPGPRNLESEKTTPPTAESSSSGSGDGDKKRKRTSQASRERKKAKQKQYMSTLSWENLLLEFVADCANDGTTEFVREEAVKRGINAKTTNIHGRILWNLINAARAEQILALLLDAAGGGAGWNDPIFKAAWAAKWGYSVADLEGDEWCTTHKAWNKRMHACNGNTEDRFGDYDLVNSGAIASGAWSDAVNPNLAAAYVAAIDPDMQPDATYPVMPVVPDADVQATQPPRIEGEEHVLHSLGPVFASLGYNYLGPGNSGPGRPVDELDALAMLHDRAYARARTNADLIAADVAFIEGANSLGTTLGTLSAAAIQAAMMFRNGLEAAGTLRFAPVDEVRANGHSQEMHALNGNIAVVWCIPAKVRNRLAHALNGNTEEVQPQDDVVSTTKLTRQLELDETSKTISRLIDHPTGSAGAITTATPLHGEVVDVMASVYGNNVNIRVGVYGSTIMPELVPSTSAVPPVGFTRVDTQEASWIVENVGGPGPSFFLTELGEQLFFEATQPSNYSGMRTSTRYVDFPTLAMLLDLVSPSRNPQANSGSSWVPIVKLILQWYCTRTLPPVVACEISRHYSNVAYAYDIGPANLAEYYPLGVNLPVGAPPVINCLYVSLSTIASAMTAATFGAGVQLPAGYTPGTWGTTCAVIPVEAGSVTPQVATLLALSRLEYPYRQVHGFGSLLDNTFANVDGGNFRSNLVANHTRFVGPNTHVLFVESMPMQTGMAYQLTLMGGIVLALDAVGAPVDITGALDAAHVTDFDTGSYNAAIEYILQRHCTEFDLKVAKLWVARTLFSMLPLPMAQYGVGWQGEIQAPLPYAAAPARVPVVNVATNARASAIFDSQVFDPFGTPCAGVVNVRARNLHHYKATIRPPWYDILTHAGIISMSGSLANKAWMMDDTFWRDIFRLSQVLIRNTHMRAERYPLFCSQWGAAANLAPQRLWRSMQSKFFSSLAKSLAPGESFRLVQDAVMVPAGSIPWWNGLQAPMAFAGRDCLLHIPGESAFWNDVLWFPTVDNEKVEANNATSYAFYLRQEAKDYDTLVQFLAWVNVQDWANPANLAAGAISIRPGASGAFTAPSIPYATQWSGYAAGLTTFEEQSLYHIQTPEQIQAYPIGARQPYRYLAVDYGGAAYRAVINFGPNARAIVNRRTTLLSTLTFTGEPTLETELEHNNTTLAWIDDATTSYTFPGFSGERRPDPRTRLPGQGGSTPSAPGSGTGL